MRDRFAAGGLEDIALSDEWHTRLSRRTRVQEFADLLERVETRA
jgi:hypothetical protein